MVPKPRYVVSIGMTLATLGLLLVCMLVVTSSHVGAVPPENFTVWDFEAQNRIPSLDLTGHATAAGGSGLTTEAYSSGNGSLWAWSFAGWSTAALDSTDYFEFAVDLTDYAHITLSFDERRSGTGIRDFEVQYSTDGSTFTQIASTVTNVPDDTNFRSHSFDFGLDTAVDLAIRGQPTVQFRIYGYSAEGSGGTWRIDNVTFHAERAIVSAVKSASPDTDVPYHGTVTYTIALKNPNATDDPNVMLTDTLPVEVDFARWAEQPEGAAVSADEVTWSGTIAANSTITFTFVVTHVGDYGDEVTNTATFSSTSTSGEGKAIFSVEKLFDVGVLKSADPLQVLVEDGASALVTYTLTISNYSQVTDTTRVTVTDVLPPGFVYVNDDSGATPSGSGTLADPLVWVLTDPITAGMDFGFQVVVSATDAITRSGSYNNEVTIDTEPPDVLVGNNSANAAVTVYRFLPIATARAGSNGELFAMEGRAIYVPGTFGTSEWGMQDSSGGISVYYSPPPAMALGDTVLLVATRGAFNNQEQMAAPVLYFANLGAGPEVDPLLHATGDIGTGSTEGWLVQVNGYVSGLDPADCGQAGNFQFNLDDGTGPAVIYVDIDTGIYLCDDVVNGDYLRVTGFSTQYSTTYEVKPRQPADIQGLYHLYLPVVVKNY